MSEFSQMLESYVNEKKVNKFQMAKYLSIDRSSLHKIIDTQRINMIIVDEGIPADSLEGLRKAGVEVILVGE